MTAILQARKLVSGYLNRPVLHDVSIDLNCGQLLGVIGPNGHGKTTLLNTLSGLVPIRDGTLTMGGTAISTLSVQQRVQMGLVHVPQGDQLFGDMTVEENLRMGAYLQTDSRRIQHKLDQVYALFPKLGERSRQIASSLSGGERRMTGIGRGLMADAKILMIDEPSLGLAPLIIEQIYAALKSMIRPHCSILVVEENPSRLLGIADSIALMDAGRVAWAGTAAEVAASKQVLDTYLGGH